MATSNFYLLLYLIHLGVISATALSLQGNCCSVTKNDFNLTRLRKDTASPVGYNASSKSIFSSSDVLPGRRSSAISSTLSPAIASTYNVSSSSCCLVMQDTIDVRYWAGKGVLKMDAVEFALLTTCYRRLPHPNHSALHFHYIIRHIRYSIHRYHRHDQCFHIQKCNQSHFYSRKCRGPNIP